MSERGITVTQDKISQMWHIREAIQFAEKQHELAMTALNEQLRAMIMTCDHLMPDGESARANSGPCGGDDYCALCRQNWTDVQRKTA